MENSQVLSDVVRKINAYFGDDLSKLADAESVLEIVQKRQKQLERKLSTTSEETDKGIVHVLQESKRMAKETRSLSNVFSKCKIDMESHLSKSRATRELFEKEMHEIGELSKMMNYLQWLSLLEEIDQKIGENLAGRQEIAIKSFLQLVTTWRHLQHSKCSHLLTYLTKSILHWFKIFSCQFGSELDKLLEQFHWPTTTPSSTPPSNPGPDALAKFEDIFNLLLQIQLPSELAARLESDVPCNEEPSHQLLPLQLMFAPFCKRFAYHFTKSRKTNRIDKPEWYLTQILAWIRDNSPFLEKYVEPLVDDAESVQVRVKVHVELMKTLVQLACNKLLTDRDQFLFDDSLMTHHVDELLLFVKELQGWGYTLPSPNVLNVLTSEPCFTKWLTLEQKFAEERMDQIFNLECAWKCRFPCTDEVDELKVPEFAECFMTMLLSMTERYQLLLTTKHQLQFLELQLKLLDDFRLRLQQLRNAEMPDPLNSKFSSILNAVYYIALVLNEWSNLPFFLKLHCSKASLQRGNEHLDPSYNMQDFNKDADMSGSVFENTISLLVHMQNDLVETLKKWILCDVKAKSRSYRTEKWFSIATSQVTDLTTSAFLMLKVLKDNLHRAHEIVSEPVFLTVVSQLAEDFSAYIFEEVVLQNLFSEGGALQLQKDINRNLIPIFGNYLGSPDSFFREVKEACVLLTLPRGSAMLLKEIIQGESTARDSLEEQGVHQLDTSTALRVLKQRTDM